MVAPPCDDDHPQGMASLYVGDLHPEVTEKDLEDAFSPMGLLVSVRLFRPPSLSNNSSLSYARINFSSPSDAFKAMACLNKVELKGVPMKIMRYQNHLLTEKFGSGAANLFVKNLDPSITSARLEGIFGKFGTILTCKVAEEDGKSKGFGFVQFASEDSAISALNALHGTVLAGKTLKAIDALNGALTGSKKLFVGKAQKKAERAELLKHTHEEMMLNRSTTENLKALNLYVKNLHVSIDDIKLEEIFSAFGRVTSVKVMRHNNGTSKGFGFVSISSPEAAKKAMDSLNGSLVEGRFLYVAVAQRKEERRRELQSHFTPRSFYDSNWEFFPLYSNYYPPLPPNPFSQANSHIYPQRQHQGLYTYFQVPMRPQPQIPMRQSQQGGTNGWVYQHHPMRYATSNFPEQGKICYTEKTSMKMESKRSGAAEVSSKGLPGRAAKITEIMLEMEKSKIQKILDSPQYLAMQVMKAAQVKGANPCAREARAVHYQTKFSH
ncbi:hypothetical protein LguiA_028720 [Lonicera macranthoides]